jgi:hypothetical protein
MPKYYRRVEIKYSRFGVEVGCFSWVSTRAKHVLTTTQLQPHMYFRTLTLSKLTTKDVGHTQLMSLCCSREIQILQPDDIQRT